MDAPPVKKAPPPASTAKAGKRYALRFISGKYQGGEFPLQDNQEIIVGRSSDLDMVLVEDMVSRKHAKLTVNGDQIFIQDLGSTNGTFVNGEKIKRARLKEGDRVLVGTSIIKLVATDAAPAESRPPRDKLLEVAAGRRTSQARTMSGTIDEVPLPDLLQLFSTSKKNGVLVIRTEREVAKIYLRKGALYYACINDNYDVSPRKSIYRMLTWTHGQFELEGPDDKEFLEEIDESTESILMNGLRQLDEMRHIQPELPDMNANLALSMPLIPPLRDLSAEELDILQLAYNYGHMETVLNKSLAMDLETCQILLKLIKNNYLKVD
jgi:pSer/pThr/pTyr-binding forkhead associated (FHA) protein